MAHDNDLLNRIFDSTAERCHLCAGPIAFELYGILGSHLSWEVDHDHPRAWGGDNHESNLLPAHVSCNRCKQASPSEVVRAMWGLSSRPLSETEQLAARGEAALGLGIVGGLTGALVAALTTPPGQDPAPTVIRGAALGFGGGAVLGFAQDPED